MKKFKLWPKQTVRRILKTMKAAPTDNPVTKLQDSEIIQCIETDIGVQVTETITNEKSLLKFLRKRMWPYNKRNFLGILLNNLVHLRRIYRANPNFHAQEVRQGHALRKY